MSNIIILCTSESLHCDQELITQLGRINAEMVSCVANVALLRISSYIDVETILPKVLRYIL